MASKKYYAYYLKGNKLAIVQRNYNLGNCSLSGYNNQTDCEAAGGTWHAGGTSAGSSEDFGQYKSPVESVADGLELEYAYSPTYRIDETDDKNTGLDTYLSLDGLLKVVDGASNNYSTSPESLSDGSYIVLEKAGKWNGLHKVKAAGVGYITLYTKFSGSASTEVSFEEAPNLYYNVSVMVDEDFELDLNRYQANAIVYYVKAKFSEDGGNMEAKEYFMREFRKMIERFHSSREHGPKKIQPFAHFNLR